MVGANKNPYITFKITIFCFIWAPTKSLDKQELIRKEKMKADRMMDPIQPTGPIKKKSIKSASVASALIGPSQAARE